MGSDLDVSVPSDVLLPDVIFHLTCDELERQCRRQAREKRETCWDRLAEQNAERILREYERFKMDIIDTTHLKPQEVVEELVGCLNKSGGEL